MTTNANTPFTSISVNIYQQRFSLSADRDAEHLTQLAQLVDQRMREIGAQLTVSDPAKVAVLAALNIADEMLSWKNIAAKRQADAAAAAASTPRCHTCEATLRQPPPETEGGEADRATNWTYGDIFEPGGPRKQLAEEISARLRQRRKE